MSTKQPSLFVLFWLCIAMGCSPKKTTPLPTPPKALPGTTLQMNFQRKAGFYSAPFPSEDLKRADGTLALEAFPNTTENTLVQRMLALLQKDARGFGVSTGVYFQSNAALSTSSFPSLEQSIQKPSPIFLISVERAAKDFGKRYPITVEFVEEGGPFGAKNLLSILPLQGVPLQEGSLVAAVVLRSLKDAQGKELGVSLSLQQLKANIRPAGMPKHAFSSYQTALVELEKLGIPQDQFAGIAVFRTGYPTKGLRIIKAYQQTQKPLTLESPYLASVAR